MTIELLPPMNRSLWRGGSDIEALTEAPAFVRTRTMGRWHRPRSGVRITWRSDGRSYVVLEAWCGQPVFMDRGVGVEQPAAGEPVCGTCEGRALGSGQVDNDGARDLTFEPRQARKPTVCPGSRKEALYEPFPDARGWPRVGRCLVCNAIEPVRASGGSAYYTSSVVALIRHAPMNLIPPCPLHGWRGLVQVDGAAVCACTVSRDDAEPA